MSQQVPVKRTVVSMRDYARAVIRAWQALFAWVPEKNSVAVLWGQYMMETGGAACWNWNIGNVKHVDGDGHDWHELTGVWEGVTTVVAQDLINKGYARLDTTADHIRAMPPGKVSVILIPPYPGTRFVAYASLDDAMVTHLSFLSKRYAHAWEEVELGDPDAFSHALKAGADGIEGTWDDYFTASAEMYSEGVRVHFANFMNSDVFEDELAKMQAPTIPPTSPDDIPTQPIIDALPDTLAPLGLTGDEGDSREARPLTGDEGDSREARLLTGDEPTET